MEKIIILSNLGSTSKKYSIYKNTTECAWFHIEKFGDTFVCSSKINSFFEKKYIEEKTYQDTINFITEQLISHSVIDSKEEVSIISIRIVVPHMDFTHDMYCDDVVYSKIKDIASTDPLHINPVIEEIELIQKHFAHETKIYLISDSSFHSTYKKPIALPFATQLHTIGYHGLACESVLQVLNKNSIHYSKLIIAHLGGGSSVTGVLNNKSVFNSMQFSPLGGMIMSSRPGSIDPLVLIQYIKEKNTSPDEILQDLYTKSGLYALSEISPDLRIIREQALSGNQKAKQTIMLFVDSIVEQIAQALTYTQGADTFVFSGTIGIRASYVRELVIEKLMWLGLILNHSQNIESGEECFEISSHDSKIKIYVVHIDEMKEMFRHTQLLLEKTKK